MRDQLVDGDKDSTPAAMAWEQVPESAWARPAVERCMRSAIPASPSVAWMESAFPSQEGGRPGRAVPYLLAWLQELQREVHELQQQAKPCRSTWW